MNIDLQAEIAEVKPETYLDRLRARELAVKVVVGEGTDEAEVEGGELVAVRRGSGE